MTRKEENNMTGLKTLAFIFLIPSNIIFAAAYAVNNQSTSSLGTALSSNGVNLEDISGQFANPAIIAYFNKPYFTLALNYTNSEIKLQNIKAHLRYIYQRLISIDAPSNL